MKDFFTKFLTNLLHKKKIILIISSVVIILFLIFFFLSGSSAKLTPPKKEDTLPGISVPETVDMSTNSKTWSETNDFLPNEFPEIIVKGHSNFSNITSQYGKTIITWSNYNLQYQSEIQQFLEKTLNASFVQNGDVITAYNVNINNSSYDISLSHTDANGESLEFVTMSIMLSS